jgi:glycosyltransferase involved in cell wall biosynthesis
MLAIFESHPVQYRAPVYQELQRLVPGSFHVFYGTDVSMRENGGVGFGKTATWDVPLLDGYPHTILDQERGNSLENFRSLHGRGLSRVFATHRPKAILQTQFLYEYDFAALFQARIRRIPVWIRLETQDAAVQRSPRKHLLRSAVYRLLYSQVQKGFYIGELNREHLRRHGLPPDRLIRAPYCTVDRFKNASRAEFAEVRASCRSEELKNKITLLYVGSGEMETEMQASARQLEQSGIKTIFSGFINQSALRDFYAATDIMVLPSRYAGETWGLVVNEALQAGCAVVVSEAVGCSREFGAWERVRTIPIEDAPTLARAVENLAVFPREFNWARERLKAYSVAAAAEAIASEIRTGFT